MNTSEKHTTRETVMFKINGRTRVEFELLRFTRVIKKFAENLIIYSRRDYSVMIVDIFQRDKIRHQKGVW